MELFYFARLVLAQTVCLAIIIRILSSVFFTTLSVTSSFLITAALFAVFQRLVFPLIDPLSKYPIVEV